MALIALEYIYQEEGSPVTYFLSIEAFQGEPSLLIKTSINPDRQVLNIQLNERIASNLIEI